MKYLALLMTALLAFSCQQNQAPDKSTDQKDAAPAASNAIADNNSYAMGYQMGSDLNKYGVSMDLASFQKGFKDGMDGNCALDPDTLKAAQQAFQMEVRKSMEAKQQQMAGKNIEESKKFLEENGKKEGVKTTESGLQYEVVTLGKGEKPKATSKVRVHYKGTLIDGTEFDSSYKRNQPAEFPLNGVIKGWTEGLQLMPVGSKFKFYIPPELGYGPRGAGQIPPNSALVFEVELLAIL